MAHAKSNPDGHPSGDTQHSQPLGRRTQQEHTAHTGTDKDEQSGDHSQQDEKIHYNGPSREPGGYDQLQNPGSDDEEGGLGNPGARNHGQGYSGYTPQHRIDEEPGRPEHHDPDRKHAEPGSPKSATSKDQSEEASQKEKSSGFVSDAKPPAAT